jgi:TolA-binding protein
VVRENHGVVQHFLEDYIDSARTLDGVETSKAFFYRGLALFAMKLYDDSVGALAKVPTDAGSSYAETAAFLKAEGFFQKKNYTLAASEFEGFLRKFPGSTLAPFSHIRRADCMLATGSPTEGIESANAAINSAKATPEVKIHASYIKGSALLALKRYSDASATLSPIGAQQDYPDLASSALVRLAWAHRNLRNDAAFLKDVKAITDRYPKSSDLPLARFLEGAYYFEDGKWEDASTHFEQAVMSQPYSVISEAALAMFGISGTRARRLDQLVTVSNSALKLFEKNYNSENGYWRGQAYYFLGRAYYDLKRYKDAIPMLEKVALQYSDHPLAADAQLALSWSYLNDGQAQKARDKATSLAGNAKIRKEISINAEFLLAATRFNSKEYDKSILGFTDFIKKHPSDRLAPNAMYLTGLSYFQKKVFGSAITEWNKLISAHPSHPLAQDAYLHVGDLYTRAGEDAKAASFYADFRKKWPNSNLAETAFWQELQCYFNAKDDEKAIVTYPVYLNKFPNSDNAADGRKQLEMIYYRRGADGDPKKLEEFLSKYPDSPFAPSARYKLGDMALEQKAWTRATLEMGQFLRDYPKDKLYVDALYGLGMAYESLNEPDKAAVQYKNLMEQFAAQPNAVDAAFRLGALQFKQEHFREAIEAFQFALQRKMSADLRNNLLYNMALAYENVGEPVAAAETYGKFASSTKDAKQAREARLAAGMLLKKVERHLEAAKYFEMVLKDAGDNETELQAINLLGESFKAAGKNREAIRAYERLVSAEPASHDLRLGGLAQLAYIYEQEKELQKAIKVYEKIAVSEGRKDWTSAAQQRIDVLATTINQLP